MIVHELDQQANKAHYDCDIIEFVPAGAGQVEFFNLNAVQQIIHRKSDEGEPTHVDKHVLMVYDVDCGQHTYVSYGSHHDHHSLFHQSSSIISAI